MPTKKYKRLLFLWVGLLLVAELTLMFQVFRIHINFTASMPIGLYQQYYASRPRHGDIVSFCLPKSIASVGKAHGYIGNGPCPGHSMSLLKQVIALPGDRVTLSRNTIQVNQQSYFAPQQYLDHQGFLVFHWVKNQTYRLIKSVWVYGSHDPIYSWDSRYFGGIPLKNIRGIYKPLWVF